MKINDLSYNATGASARYGYNSQEQSTELNSDGNHTTAEFWEYDARSTRRWNLDPVDQISKSNYSTFANNPITSNDLKGDDDFNVTGTNQSKTDVNSNEQKGYRENINSLNKVLGSNKDKPVDFDFSWFSLFPHTGEMRENAAKDLAKYIVANNTEGTNITIYGYSFGGDVGMRSLKYIKEELKSKYGEDVASNTIIQLVTLSTPLDLDVTSEFANSNIKNANWTHVYTEGDLTNIGATLLYGTIPSLTSNNYNGDSWKSMLRSNISYYTKSSFKFEQYRLTENDVEKANNNHGWPFYQSIMKTLIKKIGNKDYEK